MRYAERSTPRGSGKGSPSTCSWTGSPARPTSASERVETVKARLWAELDFVAVAPHGAEEAPHLGERCPPGPLDAPERVAILGHRVGKLVPDGADLEHHDAHGVGDDVVELAGDPRALLRHRDACRRLALALGPGRAHLPPPRPALRAPRSA